jgi:hypothetical protein
MRAECVALALCTVAAFPATARADRSYAENPLDYGGDMTLVRTSDAGSRVTFVSAHVRLCDPGAGAAFLSRTARIVRRRPARLPDGRPVLIPAGHGRLTLVQRTVFDEGVELVTGTLTLRDVGARSLRGVWSATVDWRPKHGREQRCKGRSRFSADRGSWYVGETRSHQPVAVADQGDGSAYAVIGYNADCDSGSYVWAIYGGPYALAADRSFGPAEAQPYKASVLDFNPATVLIHGQLPDATHASGVFALSVMWNGTDPCNTGNQPWTAIRG